MLVDNGGFVLISDNSFVEFYDFFRHYILNGLKNPEGFIKTSIVTGLFVATGSAYTSL